MGDQDFEQAEERWKTHDLRLNDYQRDNLLQLLRLVMTLPELGALNTGDWVGELRWALNPDDANPAFGRGRPNVSDEDIRKRFEYEREQAKSRPKGW